MFDYNKAKQQFEALNQQQRDQFMRQNAHDANFRKFAERYNQELQGQSPQPQPVPQQSAPVQETQQDQPQYQESQQGQQQEVQSQGGMQKQVTEQQTQGAPQFGYQTDEVYRKQRDAHIAQTLYTQNPNSFDYDTVYRYVRSEAQGVSDRDIHNTVRNIQSQYLQYGRLGAMKTGSVEKLREGLMNGQYSQSDLELLKAQDPERYNEYIAHEEKMNAMSNAKHNAMVGQKLMDGESVKGTRDQKEILVEKAREYFGVIDYKEEIIEQYKESLNAPEIQKHKNKMLDTQREMDEIDDSLDTLREDLMKQYPGIPKTQLNAILQDRSYKLLKRKNELHRDYVRSKGEVQFAVDMAGKNLEADLKGIEIQRMELSDKMQALGFAKGLMEFETPQQKRDAELEQIRKKAELQAELSDINSKDPKIQFNAVMQALDQYYKDFGSIILRPQAQAAQDIIDQAKREKISVGEAMRKNFTEPLQGKSGYKMLMNRQYGISNEVKVPQLVDIGGQKYEYDPVTQQYRLPQLEVGGDFTDYQMKGRANRHNNPTAMTTDVAKSLGMVEGIDYVRGDPFIDSKGSTLYTAKLLGNGVEVTMNAFDKIANDPNRRIFYNQEGKKRWTHTGMKDEDWLSLSQEDKAKVIQRMYHNEERQDRRNFGAFGYSVSGAGGYVETRAELYKAYLSDGKLPSDGKLKSMGVSLDQFTEQAYAYQEATGTVSETKEQKAEITQLRKEFNNLPEIKNFKTVQGMYNTVKSASTLGTAAGDMSLIFAYMKILDPNSTVREGEYANAQNAGSVSDKIFNLYNRVRDGTRLTSTQRSDFLRSSQALYNEYAKTYNERLEEYKSYVTGGGNSERIGTFAQVAGVNQKFAKEVADKLSSLSGSQVNMGVGDISQIQNHLSYIVG